MARDHSVPPQPPRRIEQPCSSPSKAVLADGVAAGQGHDGLARLEAAGAVRLGEDLVAARYFVRPLAAGGAGEGALHDGGALNLSSCALLMA